jgi:hypothetical protein
MAAEIDLRAGLLTAWGARHRDRVRVEDESYSRLGGLAVRASRIEAKRSSTASTVSASTAASCSKKPGDPSAPPLTSLSRARTINWFRLILRALALRSTASRRDFGMWTLVGMAIFGHKR